MSAELASIVIRGRRYSGWKSVEIIRGIEQAASTFAFEATFKSPTGIEDIQVRADDPCNVYLGDDLIITGYIGTLSPSRNATSASFPVAGRSKTGDLVDCAVICYPGQWTGQRIEVIAAAMAESYGVEVIAEVDTGDPLPKFAVQPAETVYTAIERMARDRGLLLTDDEAGRLLICRAGVERCADELHCPGNALSSACDIDSSGRYREYVCIGQRQGLRDGDAGAVIAKSMGTVIDDAISRPRTHVIMAEDAADDDRCLRRAQWEAATRAGQSLRVQMSVQGWRQSNGVLWQPDMICHVKDESHKIDDDLLITKCTWSLSDAGSMTLIELQPPDAFLPLEPFTAPAAGKQTKKTKQHSSLKTSFWKELE